MVTSGHLTDNTHAVTRILLFIETIATVAVLPGMFVPSESMEIHETLREWKFSNTDLKYSLLLSGGSESTVFLEIIAL